MHWTSYGQAKRPCLVLLHGFLGSAGDWQHIAEALSEHYYCLCPDLPGHGNSAELRLDKHNGFADFSLLLQAQLAAKGVTCYHLLGYSLGGRLAMYHACQRPEGLQSLWIESAHCGLAEPLLREQRLKSDAVWAGRWRNNSLQYCLDQWYQQAVFASLSSAQRQQLYRFRSQQNGRGLAAMLQATSLGHQPNLLPLLAQLSLPIAYLCGDNDPKFTAIAQQMQQQIVSFHWKRQANAGHNIHLEQPEHLVEWLQQGLTRIL